jgi:DNA-binding response OmpR family regulator
MPLSTNTLDSSWQVAPEPHRVILADDDEDMRRMLADVLRSDGYFVLEAKNGERLKALIGAMTRSGGVDPVALVISDQRMPGMSGIEVLEWLREHDWMTPVILLTGFGDRKLHKQAHDLGVASVFDKPFDLGALRARVRELVKVSS